MEKLLAQEQEPGRPHDQAGPPAAGYGDHPPPLQQLAQQPPVGVGVTVVINAIQTGDHPQRSTSSASRNLTTTPASDEEGVRLSGGARPSEHDFDHVERNRRERRLYPIYGDHSIREKVRPVALDYFDVLGKEVCANIKQGTSFSIKHSIQTPSE